MYSRNRVISVSVPADDNRALAVMGRALLELSGESQFVTATLTEGAIVNAVGPGQSTVAAVLEEVEKLNAANDSPAPLVGTAVVFGAVPGGATSQAPVIPAAPPAPAAPAAPAAPPTNVELDKNGLPWDARINTSNKAKTGPGVWKRTPKLTDEFYNGVIAELKATMALPVPPAAPAPPAAPVPPAAPPAPAAPVSNATDAAAEVAPTTYAQLLGSVAKHIQGGTITHEEVTNVCLMAGLPDLNSVSSRPDFVPAIYEGCKAIWATRG